MISIVPVYVQRNCKRNRQKQEQKIKTSQGPKDWCKFQGNFEKSNFKNKISQGTTYFSIR